MMKLRLFLLKILPFCFILLSLIVRSDDYSLKSLYDKASDLIYSDPDMSLYYNNMALKELHNLELRGEYDTLRYGDLKSELLMQSGILYRLLGDFDAAIPNLYDALDNVSQRNLSLTAHIESEMSNIYSMLFDFEKAIKLNEKATSIFKSLNDSLALAMCYNAKGVIKCHTYEYDVAEQLFKKALAINRSHKRLKDVAANLNNLSLYKGNSSEKIGFLNEAIAINKNLGSTWSLAENYNNLGRQYYYAGDYTKSLSILKGARKIAEELNAKGLICDNSEYLADLYVELNDYKSAYQNLNTLYSLNNELMQSDKLRMVEQHIYHQNEQKQRREAELKELYNRERIIRRNIWICIIIIAAFVAIGVLFYNWRRRKRDIELIKAKYDLSKIESELTALKLKQQEIEMENMQKAYESSQKESISFAAFVQSRTELLNKIRAMIKQCEKMKSDEIYSHLKGANLFISQYLGSDKNDNNLLVTANSKSEEFIEKLSKLHPNLTLGEKRLSSLLMINLSTKEIAILMGISPKTVNMNRYRLRKSLQLEGDEDLVNYLKKIQC